MRLLGVVVVKVGRRCLLVLLLVVGVCCGLLLCDVVVVCCLFSASLLLLSVWSSIQKKTIACLSVVGYFVFVVWCCLLLLFGVGCGWVVVGLVVCLVLLFGTIVVVVCCWRCC